MGTADFLKFVEAVGAPTVILVLIIIRIEKRLDALTNAVLGLPPIFAGILARHLAGLHPGKGKP
jgi:hypothetical protein